MAWIAPAIGAGASILGSLVDSGGSSGSQSMFTGPDIPAGDKSRLWNNFMSMFFGNPTGDTSSGGSQDNGNASAPGFQEGNPVDSRVTWLQWHIEHPTRYESDTGKTQDYRNELNTLLAVQQNADNATGTTSDASQGLQGMLQTDWNAKKTADQALLDALTGTTAQRTADINAAYDPYSGYLNQLIQGKPESAPTVSIGGMGKMPFASGLYKLNSARADKANTELYNAAANKSNLLNSLAEALAGKKADFGKTYTPNASALDYLTNYLQPLAQWAQGGMQQQNANLPGESFATILANALGTGKAVGDLYDSFKPLASFNSSMPSNYNPASIPATSAIDSILGIFD